MVGDFSDTPFAPFTTSLPFAPFARERIQPTEDVKMRVFGFPGLRKLQVFFVGINESPFEPCGVWLCFLCGILPLGLFRDNYLVKCESS